MNVDTDLEELESKIKLLDSKKQNLEFVEHVKAIIEYVDRFDLATTEASISSKIFPAIENRFNRVFMDNYSLFETLEDDLCNVLIKENLEIIFQLTEVVQELINHISNHSPVELRWMESVLKSVPTYLQLFADHWKSSSEAYKSAFAEELSKVFEVMKHLYSQFLHLLEFSTKLSENDNEISLLTDVLLVLCEMPKTLCDIDSSIVIASWRCFGTLSAKYSTMLENCLDVRIPVKFLTDDICRFMETLNNDDPDSFTRQVKIIMFLRRILFKVLTSVFYQQLNTFASELLIFYVRILRFSPEYYIIRNFSMEAVLTLENDVFKNLYELLRDLIRGQVKDHLVNFSDMLEAVGMYQTHPLGFLRLLDRILQIIGDDESDWSGVLTKLIEDAFEILPYCQKELFLDGYDGGILQHLIINISAAILRHDAEFRCTDLLLKGILQDNVFVAVLALEVYTLVASNIPPEECLLLLINLLYGVGEISYGFFTHRPELVHLKCLLQRLFKILPDALKGHVIKLFASSQHIQIWRFLGFNGIPLDQVQPILDPVLGITSDCIKSIGQRVGEDAPLNIAESISLISTLSNLDVRADARFSEVVSFIETFWSSDIDREISNNNIMKYFVSKIVAITVISMQSSTLNPHLVFQKLKILLNNQAYLISIFKIISSMLNVAHRIPIQSAKENILSEIADVLPIALSRSNNVLMRETYLEMLKKLNESQNDTLNMLLDSLDANIANQIFQYIDNCKKSNQIPDVNNIDYFNSINKFKHLCLQWKDDLTNNDASPAIKRFKFDGDQNKLQTSVPVVIQTAETVKEPKKRKQHKKLEVLSNNVTDANEDDSSATEVIDRIKGEVKCLTKVCQTEKLTQKNVAHLRILMSQMSSLM